MGIVRNCIDIVGITPENELPKEIGGQLIEASETENIYLGNELNIKNIYQIIIEVGIKGTRVINAPLNRIIVVDGFKKIKVAYYNSEDNVGVFELESPYNFFIDIENPNENVENIAIHIADAYFELVNKNILYSHILYITDVAYSSMSKRTITSKMYKNLEVDIDELKLYEKVFIEDGIEIQFDGEEDLDLEFNLDKDIDLDLDLELDKDIEINEEVNENINEDINEDVEMEVHAESTINSDNNEAEQVKNGAIKELLISEVNKLNITVNKGIEDEFIDLESEYL